MQENPKDKSEGTWSEDQKDREYYYDDAHGYEVFDPEKEEDVEQAFQPVPLDDEDPRPETRDED